MLGALTHQKAGTLLAEQLAQHVLRDVLLLVDDSLAKKLGSPRGPCFAAEAKAALKSERGSGSLRKQTNARSLAQAALEAYNQSLQAHASLKLQTPLAASTTRVRCCGTSPFWRWPMPFTLQAGLLR